MDIPVGSDPLFGDVAEVFNANADKINSRLFTYMDYAVIGAR